MYTIDDPMFALLLRFAGYDEAISLQDNCFIKKQLKTIQEYIKKFPPNEKNMRAIEWIKKYAREYRERWEKEIIGKLVSNQRCDDCPLSGPDTNEYCHIHDEWVALINQYTAGEINSKEYIENTLKLLTQHKEDLKIKLSELQEQA
jgi:predicted metal-dependent hydrolase